MCCLHTHFYYLRCTLCLHSNQDCWLPPHSRACARPASCLISSCCHRPLVLTAPLPPVAGELYAPAAPRHDDTFHRSLGATRLASGSCAERPAEIEEGYWSALLPDLRGKTSVRVFCVWLCMGGCCCVLLCNVGRESGREGSGDNNCCWACWAMPRCVLAGVQLFSRVAACSPATAAAVFCC